MFYPEIKKNRKYILDLYKRIEHKIYIIHFLPCKISEYK